MIVTVVNQCADPALGALARNLAVLRAAGGSKVCILDIGPSSPDQAWSAARGTAGVAPWIAGRAVGPRGLSSDLSALVRQFDDILIDAGKLDAQDSRYALVAANLALVLVPAAGIDLANQYALITRLDAARCQNPGLRVVLVPLCRSAELDAQAMAAVREFAARLRRATLSPVTIHGLGQHDYGAGRCACDAGTCDPELAGEIRMLYRQMYAPPGAALGQPV